MSIILVRYGEIALKSRPVRNRFERVLVGNIRQALKQTGLEGTVKRGFGRMFVEAPLQAIPVLQRVFGIVSLSPCETCGSGLEEIKKRAVDIAKKELHGTFAVRAHRIGSHPYTSQKVNEEMGTAICSLGKKVNLSRPDTTLFIEVRDKTAYLYTEKIPGPGGFPLGTQGRVAVLMETRKDLLATWLFMKRGAEVVLVFPKKPFGLELLEKWASRPLRHYETALEEVLKAERISGIVSCELKEMGSLKERHSLPVYNPLLGMGEKEIRRGLHTIRSIG